VLKADAFGTFCIDMKQNFVKVSFFVIFIFTEGFFTFSIVFVK